MLSIISSSKTLNFDNEISYEESNYLLFSEVTEHLIGKCKHYSIEQLEKLMKISHGLAKINYLRFQEFERQPYKPAILAYDGDVYHKIKASEFTSQQRDFLQSNLLIISGLYGLLRPLDLIRPYRLEMAVILDEVGHLASFWQEKIVNYINKTLTYHTSKYLINLASKEYSSAIDTTILKYPMINIHFKEIKNGKLQTIGINAKRVRGSMINFIGKNFVSSPEILQNFSELNYRFSRADSLDNDWIFIKQ